MVLLSSIDSGLRALLVDILAKHPSATAEWLHKHVNRHHRNYTERAIFHALKELQEDGVILKVKSLYSLRLAWLHQQLATIEKTLKRYEEKSSYFNFLEPDKKKQIWRFSDLHRLDDFWINLTLALIDNSRVHQMYYWIEHGWFQFLHPEKEKVLHDAIDLPPIPSQCIT